MINSDLVVNRRRHRSNLLQMFICLLFVVKRTNLTTFSFLQEGNQSAAS